MLVDPVKDLFLLKFVETLDNKLFYNVGHSCYY